MGYQPLRLACTDIFPSCESRLDLGWCGERGNLLEIYDVRVDRPQYKRRGIGTALVHAAIDLAQRSGESEIRGCAVAMMQKSILFCRHGMHGSDSRCSQPPARISSLSSG